MNWFKRKKYPTGEPLVRKPSKLKLGAGATPAVGVKPPPPVDPVMERVTSGRRQTYVATTTTPNAQVQVTLNNTKECVVTVTDARLGKTYHVTITADVVLGPSTRHNHASLAEIVCDTACQVIRDEGGGSSGLSGAITSAVVGALAGGDVVQHGDKVESSTLPPSDRTPSVFRRGSRAVSY